MLSNLSSQNIQLPIHETFQRTVQGEGFWVGAPSDFIRLHGCPVRCPWCDTGYSDGGRNIPKIRRTIGDLTRELVSPRVVITGGEPLIHAAVVNLCEAILTPPDSGVPPRNVSIETSGIKWQDVPNEVWITLSPKHLVSPSAVVDEKMWSRANEIKLVISDGSELDFYAPYLNQCSPDVHLFVQPEWENHQKSLSVCLELLSKHPRFRLSIQTHKFLRVP